jgi:hypothetical protein
VNERKKGIEHRQENNIILMGNMIKIRNHVIRIPKSLNNGANTRILENKTVALTIELWKTKQWR